MVVAGDSEVLVSRELIGLLRWVVAENERLRAENQRLAARVEELEREVEELRRQGARQAAPFSKGRPKTNRKRPGRKPGQGPFTRRTDPDPQAPAERVPCNEMTCPEDGCDGPLVADGYEKVTITDLPATPKPEIKTLWLEICRCTKCGKRVRAKHPEVPQDQTGATAHRLGERVVAAALVLNYGIGVPMCRVPRILEDLFGLRVTQSALTQQALKHHKRGQPGKSYEQLRQEIPQLPVVYTDDTSWRVDGKPAHLMGFETDQTTVYQIRRQHRNEEVREVVPEDYQGTLSCDRGKSYDAKQLNRVAQNKCLAHLDRSAKHTKDDASPEGKLVCQQLLDVFEQANQLWKRQHSGDLTMERYLKKGRKLLKELDRLLCPGQQPDKATQTLIDGLRRQHEKKRLLTFLRDPSIEPTNNRAERMLRDAVIARKVSQCSKTQDGADTYAGMKSLIRTMRQRGIKVLDGVVSLVRGIDPFARAPAAADSS